MVTVSTLCSFNSGSLICVHFLESVGVRRCCCCVFTCCLFCWEGGGVMVEKDQDRERGWVYC